jgi:hypothetical protein
MVREGDWCGQNAGPQVPFGSEPDIIEDLFTPGFRFPGKEKNIRPSRGDVNQAVKETSRPNQFPGKRFYYLYLGRAKKVPGSKNILGSSRCAVPSEYASPRRVSGRGRNLL